MRIIFRLTRRANQFGLVDRTADLPVRLVAGEGVESFDDILQVFVDMITAGVGGHGRKAIDSESALQSWRVRRRAFSSSIGLRGPVQEHSRLRLAISVKEEVSRNAAAGEAGLSGQKEEVGPQIWSRTCSSTWRSGTMGCAEKPDFRQLTGSDRTSPLPRYCRTVVCGQIFPKAAN